MNPLQAFWQGLSRAARTGFVAGVTVILLVTAAGAWWLLRTDYQVLFADLKPQDAQAMTTELEQMKIAYRLVDGGSSILVDSALVPATRIKLMGKDLPLHGAVGLELFNSTDFGMTEFAQKINYQRALQGELTRTIQSLAEVQDVRVLLALPEQGLFKQATSRAKASLTLALRQGRVLRAEQVTGIQRLVAAAVPGMTTQDVTIVDSQGVALTRTTGVDGDGDGDGKSSSARLDLKRETENYLSRKVGVVLDGAFGPGQALASVDVTLNMDQIRTTTEDVLPAAARNGLQATGVIVKEREMLRDGGTGAEARPLDAGPGARGSSQRDVDYAVGRRVEQVVTQPGSVRRIQVAVVVRTALDTPHQEQLRRLVAAAVGALPDRGDTVVVQTLAAIGPPPASVPGAPAGSPRGTSKHPDTGGPAPAWSWPSDRAPWLPVAAVGLLVLVLLALLLGAVRRRPAVLRGPDVARLSEAERLAALRRVQAWMGRSAG